jgi:dTDP-4-dehydrorhamnose reductase
MPQLLLLGTTGQVGWELQRCLSTLGELTVANRQPSAGQQYADLADFDSLYRLIRQIKPEVIVNAAAYTAVDKAEEESNLAHAINGTAPGLLAEEAKQLNALLIHYSTDYVFSGEKQTPYVETDPVNPLGAYGESKLAGEQAIIDTGANALIFRTAWVYGMRGKNFLLTMQRLARERDELRVVADQWGAPTWSRSIAEATAQVLSQLFAPARQGTIKDYSGIYHLTCAGETNWHGFAQSIVQQGERQVTVHPITTADYPTPARRPAYSVLSNEKLAATFGLTLPAWDDALRLCLGK